MAGEKDKNGEPKEVIEQQRKNPESIQGKVEREIQDSEKSSSGESFLDTIYNKITDVIGGDNPNQYFCMCLPGTIINPEEYSYEGSEKPPHVKANESKLVNKMFDACFISAADNGRVLQNQYKTALNMLSPKLNRDLFEMKIRLREVLMTPYQYDFGDGTSDRMTLEQVFYRLYNDYVSAKSEWNQMQANKKAELKRVIIDPNERRDAYLEWYGLVAEAESVKLEEKLGKVLNVFSPSDMNIINAILNCGVGGEIESARNTLNMVEELSPDGGYVYPVNLQPSNWFKLLDSSFTGVDLLESPAALSQRMKNLQMQQRNIMLNINKLTSSIPDESEIKELREIYIQSENSLQNLVGKCIEKNSYATVDSIKAIISLCSKGKDDKGKEKLYTPEQNDVERIIYADTNESSGAENEKDKNEKIGKLIECIINNGVQCFEQQAKAVKASDDCADAALKWCDANNRFQLKKLLEPLKIQLEDVNNDISELKEKIIIARSVHNSEETNNVGDIMPNKETEGYTQVLIQSTMAAATSKSSRESSSSNSTTGASFFWGGYSKKTSHSESYSADASSESEIDIQIGMNIAKVQIEREWFNPGVFLLTESMYNFSSNKIAPDNTTSFTEGDVEEIKKRFDEMNACIFPSYPVAFVVAKDVTIRFSSRSSMSSSFAQTVEDRASRGGGFFIFSSSSSSASSSSQSMATAHSTANSVTVRFTAPQILGYYMQATPADKSTHINSTADNDMSIIGFISKFKEMIEEYNKGLRERQKDK